MEEGLPLPALNVYRPLSNLALEVAQLLGDQDLLEAAKGQKKISITVPERLVGRVAETVKRVRKAVEAALPAALGPGRTSAKLTKEKRKDPLF